MHVTPENPVHEIKTILIAGKHVLCESPITLKKNECEELFDLAQQKNLILFDSIKTAYSTAYDRLVLLAKGGRIGEVVSVDVTCTSLKENQTEDEEAEALVWEILKTHQDRYDEFSKRITILDVGSCSVVDTLNDYSQHNKLPYKSVSIVDGDKKTEYPDCLSLPGNRAPEKMVFEDLKNLEWNNLTERFGMGAGALYKILDDAMLEPDHHFWTEYVVNVKPFALDERNAADFHQRRGL